MSRAYPRLGDSRRMKKWDALPEPQRPKCVVCGQPATRVVFVQVDWFRGNDEGPFKACRTAHEAEAFLKTGGAA